MKRNNGEICIFAQNLLKMEQVNPYLKQFPDLFDGKKIMYVHGFGSSGQSGTVSRIRKVLPHSIVIAPDLPVHPQEALDLLRQICNEEHPDLIIGTSMGGMYTEMLYGFDRIVINPAFGIADTMSEHGMMGRQQFFSPRKDGIQDFYVDKPLVKEYRMVSSQNFSRAEEPEEQHHVWGLFGDEDPLVHTYDLFREHYPTAIRFHGEHRMNDQSFIHAVLPVIRWIDDHQTHRERPVVLIDISTLKDKWDKPQSSSQKAVSILLETYQLYFIAPAPTETSHYATINDWLSCYINVPAYAHTIFTNQKELLYGDYLIDSYTPPLQGDEEKDASGLATLIPLGSDTFKTWEDILEYFSRLGGQ